MNVQGWFRGTGEGNRSSVNVVPSDRFACRCVLCRDYGDRDDADRVDLKISESIRACG
jgi:hypothetical protein